MGGLQGKTWEVRYDSDVRALVEGFYVPALSEAVRYDRSAGFFSPASLLLALRGVERMVGRGGKMRLIVGWTLPAATVQAISEGEAQGVKLGEAVAGGVVGALAEVAHAEDGPDALELLSWMIAYDVLDVRVALPCDDQRRPLRNGEIFHEKAGIIQDEAGDVIAFSGSVNETKAAWTGHWESFHVFRSWGQDAAHADAEDESFQRLWHDKAKHCLVVSIGQALAEGLKPWLPEGGKLPKRLTPWPGPKPSPEVVVPEVVEVVAQAEPEQAEDAGAQEAARQRARALVWGYVREAPKRAGLGDWIGSKTANVEPWPHQRRAFLRMYEPWIREDQPPRLLIADEVGLGKTIQAGLLLRQAWLAGKLRRGLVIAPKAVLRQWQAELREKFNLRCPIYDGQRLCWAGRGKEWTEAVGADDWTERAAVTLVSSQLVRRKERAQALRKGPAFDLIILDEAHHARRRGAGSASQSADYNQLMQLMRALTQAEKVRGLVLLTATPMQIAPVELWDLLRLLGLSLGEAQFDDYIRRLAKPQLEGEDIEWLCQYLRTLYPKKLPDEAVQEALRAYKPAQHKAGQSLGMKEKWTLDAIHAAAKAKRAELDTEQRKLLHHIARTASPMGQLISRNTRTLLRRYGQKIAQREVHDRWVTMTDEERTLYEEVEDYISRTYARAGEEQRNAVGFVMTIYRRRLASSFEALGRTLNNRKTKLQAPALVDADKLKQQQLALTDDLIDETQDGELLDTDELDAMEAVSAQAEELSEIAYLLDQLRELRDQGDESKKKTLLRVLTQDLPSEVSGRVMIFTQYTDTMDSLRELLKERLEDTRILCFSGRGGEVQGAESAWMAVSKEEIKRLFKEERRQVLLCTDAAAEGLNFQFCGALINYDMPWNPMRVEQRIGRIDRLGQRYDKIFIFNLQYEDTVEADVYKAVEDRIKLFTQYVGKLQPILSALPKYLSKVTLAGSGKEARGQALAEIAEAMKKADAEGVDIGEITPEVWDPPKEAGRVGYTLESLERVLERPWLMPAGVSVSKQTAKEHRATVGGHEAKVTTETELFDKTPELLELWSPGSPMFPSEHAEGWAEVSAEVTVALDNEQTLDDVLEVWAPATLD